MKIELWEVGRIQPYDKNPRQNDQAVDAVARSIREYGFRQPVVVDADGVIICGHTRYKAAQKLGLEKVPVVIREAWPLANWSWMDVWAHIISNDLPYLSHYDRAAELAGSYREVRLCTLFDRQFEHMGVADNFLYWNFRNM